MKVQASAKHLRISPRKARLIVDAVRGLPVEVAEQNLRFMNKRGAPMILKVLKSAVANAVNNNKLDAKNLYVAEAVANAGFVIKRYRARAFGRAAQIKKRTTHVTFVVAEKPGTQKTDKKAEKKAVKGEAKAEKKVEKKADKKKPTKKSTAKK